MSLWTYQFNLDEAEIRKEDNNVVKKICFFLSHHCKFLNFCSSFFVNLFDHLPMHLQCSKQYFCVLQGQLIVDHATFKSETSKRELTRLNKTWGLSKMDLVLHLIFFSSISSEPTFFFPEMHVFN